MERVETLIKKLQEQLSAKVPTAQMLLTVQMLHTELAQAQASSTAENYGIAIDVPQIVLPTAPQTEEKIFEVLQVDEAELEAELEEIKRNAAAIQKISVQNKPAIIFEDDDQTIPTLAHHLPPKKEINDIVADNTASINDKLKQTQIDLGDTLHEVPVKDLRKAVGVNDKFLFINELFRGDESMYERSIKTINSFSILPEAEYWIQRELKTKIGWKEDSEVVQQFIQLVRRRFSSM